MGDPQSTTHPCPGGCSRPVPRHRFACGGCWRRLPVELQKPITDNYRCDAGAHLAALATACDWYRRNPGTAEALERCERTELLVGQCACRDHRGGADSAQEQSQGRARLLAKPNWFAARYAGTCDCCGERFLEGTAIRMDLQRGWRAECCAEEGGDGRG